MKIITLGTGNAFTSDGRANVSVLLDGTFKVLFDCSPQTIQSLRKLNLAPNQIDYIFLLNTLYICILFQHEIKNIWKSSSRVGCSRSFNLP